MIHYNKLKGFMFTCTSPTNPTQVVLGEEFVEVTPGFYFEINNVPILANNVNG